MKKIIDVHNHFMLKEYEDTLAKYDRANEDGFPHPKWNIAKQLEYMELAGIEKSVLSLSTPHQYIGDKREACVLTRKLNQYLANIKKKYPDKFLFAACLPLPEIEESLEELEYAFTELHTDAVKVPSNANGVYLGDKKMDKLFAELNKKNAIVIIHPSKPLEVPGGCYTSGPMPLFEYFGDTTRAVVNMIANGTLERFPNVKMIIPHCGSFLPNIVDRLEGMTKVMSSLGIGEPVTIEKSLKNCYFDIAGDSLPRGMKILMTLAKPDHILFGGDFPYTPAELIADRIRRLENEPELKPYLNDIFYENANRLFMKK